jgi:hypothetical protein
MTVGRTTCFPGVVVTVGCRGPDNGDDRADGTVPGYGNEV